MKIDSYSSKDTMGLGTLIGQEARKGDIFCLTGDLGAGKTVFTQGFAKGVGHEDYVTSPTFNLMNEYTGGRMPIYHFDLYRLAGGDIESIGYEDYLYGGGVALIEWAELAKDLIPPHAIWITITTDFDKDPNYRQIEID